MPTSVFPFDARKFQSVHQLGGIHTALIDHPSPGGRPGAGGRVALVNTGSPLRFTVALDRGGDIVEAFFGPHSLAFLTPNGYKPPEHAYHSGDDWLIGWPGGLVTSCGPQYVGAPRTEDGKALGLHGHHSNTPAALTAIHNPDPARGDPGMSLSLTVRDTRFYGPVVELRRVIRCRLGQPVIHIADEVTNLGDEPVAHNWLYHVNLGYPLLDQGARFIYRGRLRSHWDLPAAPTARLLAALKTVPAPLREHHGEHSRGLVYDVEAGRDGRCHAGIVNPRLGLALELSYDATALPRLANWQHFGPRGAYVSGVEPFSGSLLGRAKDDHPQAGQTLRPGESRRYDLTIAVHSGPLAIRSFARHDGPVRV